MARKQYERLQMLIQAKMWFKSIKEQDSGENPIITEYVAEVVKKIKDEIDSEEDRLFGTGSTRPQKEQARAPKRAEQD